jgi:hypothetical protein
MLPGPWPFGLRQGLSGGASKEFGRDFQNHHHTISPLSAPSAQLNLGMLPFSADCGRWICVEYFYGKK